VAAQLKLLHKFQEELADGFLFVKYRYIRPLDQGTFMVLRTGGIL
jgi:hypothetical protein